MARNQYAGLCYRCNTVVLPGDGYFERFLGGWRVHHVSCCKEARARGNRPDPARRAAQVLRWRREATGGRGARLGALGERSATSS